MKRLHLVCLLALFATACVSVELPSTKSRKSTDMVFNTPAAPFEELKSESADKVWLSTKTGNTISFLSECENMADPSLKQLENDSLSALGNPQIESTSPMSYNGREAVQTTATGSVDGVAIKLKLLVFKKNNCSYTLSYAGVAKNFSSELKRFDDFVKDFKVP